MNVPEPGRRRAIIPTMLDQEAAKALAEALETLSVEVAALTFPTPGPTQDRRVALQQRIIWIIREFLLRRLNEPDGALRVVVVGPTGSGASTLLNSLAGAQISEAGPLRPTTTVPVVWCDPTLEPEFAFDFLTGFGTAADASRPLRIVAMRHPIVQAAALVDAPDFDSTAPGNRQVAELLADAADVCLLVVSRHRYADAAVWEFVRHMADRPVRMAAVMSRLERGDDPAVDDFRTRLEDAGFPNALVGVIAEQPLADGRLPEDALESLLAWLGRITDPETRPKRAREGLSAALGGLFRHLDALDGARQADLAEGAALRDAAAKIVEAHGDDVVARMATVATRADLAALMEREIAEARRQVAAAWVGLPGGEALLDGLSGADVGDIAGTVATEVSEDGIGDEMTMAVGDAFRRYAATLGALAQLPAPIGPVERAAATVMDAGRRFFDA